MTLGHGWLVGWMASTDPLPRRLISPREPQGGFLEGAQMLPTHPCLKSFISQSFIVGRGRGEN